MEKQTPLIEKVPYPHDTHSLNIRETREILTPFAFELDKTLFGTPLAEPWKRAVAISIDFLCIAILSSAPGELLAFVIAITFYKMGKKNSIISNSQGDGKGKIKGRKRRAVMRFCGAMILLVMLLSLLPKYINPLIADNPQYGSIQNGVEDDDIITGESLGFSKSILLTTTVAKLLTTMSDNPCKTVGCWFNELQPSVKDFAEIDLNKETITKAFNSIVEETQLNKTEQTQLLELLIAEYFLYAPSQVQLENIEDDKSPEQEAKNGISEETIENYTKSGQQFSEQTKQLSVQQASQQEKVDSKSYYSIVELIKGIINDLGLGFGWAAFYFTVFTAVWSGQTLGKKLLGIKVLQLDGTPLSFWDSFGRYGGYGAGLATGLLGFLQVYWDANRQAIHDKISATVVINVKKFQSLELEQTTEQATEKGKNDEN